MAVKVKSAKKDKTTPLVLGDSTKSAPFIHVVSESQTDEEPEEDFEDEEDPLFDMLVEDSGFHMWEALKRVQIFTASSADQQVLLVEGLIRLLMDSPITFSRADALLPNVDIDPS